MKNKYNPPAISIELLEKQDVLTLSNTTEPGYVPHVQQIDGIDEER